jgi:hypothetical protein
MMKRFVDSNEYATNACVKTYLRRSRFWQLGDTMFDVDTTAFDPTDV